MLLNHKLSEVLRFWTAGLESPGHSHLLGSGPVEIGELVDEGKENVIKLLIYLTKRN